MRLLKKMVPGSLKIAIRERLGVPSLGWSLKNLRGLGFVPSFVVDVGAYQGEWTTELLQVYPQARVLMVEAQQKKQEFLQKVVNAHPNVNFEICVLAASDGLDLTFAEDETASYVVRSGDGAAKHLQSQTLDSVLAKKQLGLPDMLKLDVQGYELEVLTGAEKALAHAEICLLEVALLDYGKGNPLLVDIVKFMDEKGFQVYDISKFMRRPFDLALDQLDVFFIRKDSKFISEKRWS